MADTGIRQWGGGGYIGGAAYFRGVGTYLRLGGGGPHCKIINGGGGGGGSPLLAHRKYVLLTVTVLQSARNEVDVIW